MRECLKCKKDISGKHESAKFCSTSCRVMWNRNPKNKKEKGLTELQQMKVMYNALMEKIDKIVPTSSLPISELKSGGYGVIPQIEETAVKKSVWDEEPKKKIAIRRNPAQWVELRRECETGEDYAKWLEDLENSDLSTRDKNLIKQTI